MIGTDSRIHFPQLPLHGEQDGCPLIMGFNGRTHSGQSSSDYKDIGLFINYTAHHSPRFAITGA
jgi:hypothetical protein